MGLVSILISGNTPVFLFFTIHLFAINRENPVKVLISKKKGQ